MKEKHKIMRKIISYLWFWVFNPSKLLKAADVKVISCIFSYFKDPIDWKIKIIVVIQLIWSKMSRPKWLH